MKTKNEPTGRPFLMSDWGSSELDLPETDLLEFHDQRVSPDFRIPDVAVSALQTYAPNVGRLLGDSTQGLETRLASSEYRAIALSYVSAARAHLPPLRDAEADRVPTTMGSAIEQTKLVDETTEYRTGVLRLVWVRGLLSKQTQALMQRADHLGEPGAELLSENSYNPEKLTMLQHSMYPSELRTKADLLKQLWALFAVPPVEVFAAVPIPEHPEVVREVTIESPEPRSDDAEPFDQPVAIDNLPEDLHDLAKRAAWVAAHEGGAKPTAEPTQIGLKDLFHASMAKPEMTTPDERDAFIGRVANAVRTLQLTTAGETMRAELTLEPPGQGEPLTLFEASAAGAAVTSVSCLEYQSRHAATNHQFLARQYFQLEAKLDEDTQLVLAPVSGGDQSAPHIVQASGVLDLSAGDYAVSVVKNGAIVETGALRLPTNHPTYRDLSQYLGCTIRMPGHDVALIADPKVGKQDAVAWLAVKATPAEEGEGKTADHRDRLGLPKSWAPGRYEVWVGDSRLRVDVFPGGLVQASKVVQGKTEPLDIKPGVGLADPLHMPSAVSNVHPVKLDVGEALVEINGEGIYFEPDSEHRLFAIP